MVDGCDLDEEAEGGPCEALGGPDAPAEPGAPDPEAPAVAPGGVGIGASSDLITPRTISPTRSGCVRCLWCTSALEPEPGRLRFARSVDSACSEPAVCATKNSSSCFGPDGSFRRRLSMIRWYATASWSCGSPPISEAYTSFSSTYAHSK